MRQRNNGRVAAVFSAPRLLIAVGVLLALLGSGSAEAQSDPYWQRQYDYERIREAARARREKRDTDHVRDIANDLEERARREGAYPYYGPPNPGYPPQGWQGGGGYSPHDPYWHQRHQREYDYERIREAARARREKRDTDHVRDIANDLERRARREGAYPYSYGPPRWRQGHDQQQYPPRRSYDDGDARTPGGYPGGYDDGDGQYHERQRGWQQPPPEWNGQVQQRSTMRQSQGRMRSMQGPLMRTNRHGAPQPMRGRMPNRMGMQRSYRHR